MSIETLQSAIKDQEIVYTKALDRMRGMADDAGEEVGQEAWALKECIELARCLRRLTAGRTVREIHQAFGAPGDFGYETAIGAALAKVYSTPG